MPNTFTLDSLREEVDKEFAPFEVPLSDGTKVTLRSLLRLSKTTREAVLEAIDALNGNDEGAEAVTVQQAATKILELVGDRNIKKLIKEIDGDIPLLLHVIKKWMETTQLGEAGNSPDSSTDTASSSSQTSESDTTSTSETSA